MAEPQSGVFACNLEAVDRTVHRLGRVLEELHEPVRPDTASESALASDRITTALRDFVNDSSQHRENIVGSTDALASMLKGLSDGVRTVDGALNASLPGVAQEALAVSAPLPPQASSVASGQGEAG
ncbi:hypothetical protein [uncultured Pseudokineococcus sp.]|uniref:hypothetical protein n=1 Tax=uncultured Pseudokineococcus sp. TaxID=1642928 RepID=UPI00261DB7F3|nr:hypothetical protein [uncultured Pseudokineococcus sp.]